MRAPAQPHPPVHPLGRPAGTRPPHTMRPTTLHIQVTRAFWYAGAVQPVGSVLALPAMLASELVHNGKATPCAAPADASATGQPGKAGKPKTTPLKPPPEATPS